MFISTLKYFLPAILWSVVIFVLSTRSGIDLPESWMDFISWDKIGHAGVYCILTILLLIGFYQKGKKQNLSTTLSTLMVIISSIYGISMEIVQYSFFPGRFFAVMDIIANIIGSLIGLIIFKHFFTK